MEHLPDVLIRTTAPDTGCTDPEAHRDLCVSVMMSLAIGEPEPDTADELLMSGDRLQWRCHCTFELVEDLPAEH